MSKSLVECAYCKSPFLKENREINRTKKRGRRHFCNSSCSAHFSNEPRKSKPIEQTCPCGKNFWTNTSVKTSKDHCSPSCASRFSITERRLEGNRKGGLMTMKQNLLPQDAVLRLREGHKYEPVRNELLRRNVSHTWEYPLEKYVFDLCLTDDKLLVEFDGKYHRHPGQKPSDHDKDLVAVKNGFRLLRVEVQAAEILKPELAEWILRFR